MIEKEGNKTVVTGLVEDHVDTWEGDSTHDLKVGYESIDSIFRSYKGEKIRVTIEVLEDESVNDDDNEEYGDEEEGW